MLRTSFHLNRRKVYFEIAKENINLYTAERPLLPHSYNSAGWLQAGQLPANCHRRPSLAGSGRYPYSDREVKNKKVYKHQTLQLWEALLASAIAELDRELSCLGP
jgi:hypothetical protein